jgi:hypothetical protein
MINKLSLSLLLLSLISSTLTIKADTYVNNGSFPKNNNPAKVQLQKPNPTTTTLAVAPDNSGSNAETYLKYEGNARYYVAPNGKVFFDKRRVGPIYPNLFDVVRTGASTDFIATEDEDNGCNLEKMFLNTVYKKYGFDVRRYMNSLASAKGGSCNNLASIEEQNLCKQFQTNSACNGAKPLVLEVINLPTGQNYLTYQATKPFSCTSASDSILKYSIVPKQSKEWSKIESDLKEKKRAVYTSELKGKAPVSKIRQEVLARNGSVSQREVDFAINEWVYTESKKLAIQISDSEIRPVAQKRYSPSSAINNVLEFKSEIGGNCKGKESRYNSKVYSEGMNIPAHEILTYADFVNPSNGCICKK